MGKSILICGSMAHFEAMQALAAKPETRGFAVRAPADERGHAGDPIAIKRTFSRRYFRRLHGRATRAILVANCPKQGRRNYIGANTFGEIAVAFSADKAIYLLHGLYPPLKDELLAWGAIALNGRLNRLRMP